jgi:flagellar protein FlaJ
MARLKFLLFSSESAGKFHSGFLWVGILLEKIFPSTRVDLENAEVGIPAKNFLTACFFSSLFYGFLFFLLSIILGIFSGNTGFFYSLAAGLVFFALFLFITAFSPKITAMQLAVEIDRNLVLALRSILVQITSGSSLYDAMVSVAKSKYGIVSSQFNKVIQSINSGDSEVEALEKIALNSRSEYLSRACWQILTSLRSGSSLAGSVSSVIDLLLSEQERGIKNYSSELNLFVLLYLLFAAAVPTLGVTFMVVFSSLGGTAVGQAEILEIVALAFIIQVVLIGFVKSRTPKVFD